MTSKTLTNRLADVLVEHVTDPEVTDTLFSKVSHARAVQLKADLAPHRALQHCKGGIVPATTIAQSATDPAVLDRYARDPRKTVRRAVAANPSLGTKTASYLHKWALAKSDHDSLKSVLPLVPIEEALAGAGSVHYYPWRALATAFTRDGSREAYLQARASGHRRLITDLAPSVHDGKVAGLSLTEFLAEVSPETRRSALERVAHSTRMLTSEAVGLVIEIGGEIHFTDVTEVESSEVIQQILQRDDEALLVSLARCRVNASIVHKLLDRGYPSIAMELVEQRQRKLTSAMAEKVIPLLVRDNCSVYTVQQFFKEVTAPISSEAALTLLRRGSLVSTREWLSGNYAATPKPGDVAALVAEPGRAFFPEVSHRTSKDVPSQEEMARQLRPTYRDVLGKPWARELVDALGKAFLEEACTNSAAAAYLTRVMTSTMGDRPPLWEVALDLAPEWSGGLTGLLEMAYLTQGEVPPASVQEVLQAPVKRAREAGQLLIPGL